MSFAMASRLPLAERLLALAAAEGATQAEALVLVTCTAVTRFANSEIHQNVSESDTTASLRFVVGRRVGVASSNRLDDDGLRALVETAGRIARVQPETEEFVSLPQPGPLPDISGAWSRTTAEASPERRADGVATVVAAADRAGVLAFGAFTTSEDGLTVANSLGIRAEEDTTRAHLVTVCMGPDGESGYAEALAVDVDRIDPAALGHEASERAVRSRAPVALAPGRYPVVLESYAVADLVSTVGALGFSALAVQEGRSFFEPGRRIASELVSMWDDATDPLGTPSRVDYEGVGKQRVQFIDHGRCRDLVYDAATAAREGRRSTGHGWPAPNPSGPWPSNQFMAPGDAALADLVAGVERGLLVTRFHYTNPVHPKLAIVTGMTRDGTFLIERGEVRGPVRNLRFTQSYLDALSAVEAVGRDRRLVSGDGGACLVPAVRIGDWDFTGGTEH
jgi:PmbA protein